MAENWIYPAINKWKLDRTYWQCTHQLLTNPCDLRRLEKWILKLQAAISTKHLAKPFSSWISWYIEMVTISFHFSILSSDYYQAFLFYIFNLYLPNLCDHVRDSTVKERMTEWPSSKEEEAKWVEGNEREKIPNRRWHDYFI